MNFCSALCNFLFVWNSPQFFSVKLSAVCGAGEGRGHRTCVIRLAQLLVQQIFVSFKDPPHTRLGLGAMGSLEPGQW